MIAPNEAVARMAAYALADPIPPGARSLAQNESPFPASPAALEAGARALAKAALYPDPDWRDLRAAIAETHDVDPARILCGAGSLELIQALFRAYLGPKAEALGSAHGYLFAATACAQLGAAYRTAPERHHHVVVDHLLEQVRPATRLVFLCNPGNPTGARIANSEILRLRARLPDHALLVVDQAYGDFDEQDPRPIFDLVRAGATVVLRTFSKAHALAGARVGWGLFPAAVAAETRKLLNPNNLSTVSQAMATASMRDRAHLHSNVANTAAIRDRFVERLRQGGFAMTESRANFALIPFASATEASAADAALRREGFVLRSVAAYGLGHCLRATIIEEDAMNAVADILRAKRWAS